MIAVRISVATHARRNRNAWVIRCSPPRWTEPAAASVRVRCGEPFAGIGPDRGRSWVLHHLLVSSVIRVTGSSRIPPSRPPACVRAPTSPGKAGSAR